MADRAPGIWRARASLIALFALFFVPIVVSMFLVVTKPGWTPFGTVNRGDLIEPPVPMLLEESRPVDDGEPLVGRSAGKWLLAYLSTGGCDETCLDALVAIRQARLALGREADRVERVWLVTGDVPAVRMREVLDGFPGLHAYQARPKLAKLFPRPASDAIYVVDPAGLLVLRYEGKDSASDVLKDMKRLLKISKQG